MFPPQTNQLLYESDEYHTDDQTRQWIINQLLSITDETKREQAKAVIESTMQETITPAEATPPPTRPNK